jgi:hypothetical protein
MRDVCVSVLWPRRWEGFMPEGFQINRFLQSLGRIDFTKHQKPMISLFPDMSKFWNRLQV